VTHQPMTTVSKLVHAAPEAVFDQLADGWIFPVWVVGASHIRGVDDGWPAPGTKLHHKIGAWPLMLNDDTRVLEMTSNRRLVLQARIEIVLEPKDDGCLVTMSEGPTQGLAHKLDNPLQRYALRRRNLETLDRLATLAEKRIVQPRPR
jgi:hypothetical protein